LPGDRFIIRQFSPVVTIGGGVVLDAAPIARMPGRGDFLQILAGGEKSAILQARIARQYHEGISIARLVAETGWTSNLIEAHLAQAVNTGAVVRAGELFLHLPALEALKLHLLRTVGEFHKKNPLVSGISKEELREQVGAVSEVFEAVAAMLVREKKL